MRRFMFLAQLFLGLFFTNLAVGAICVTGEQIFLPGALEDSIPLTTAQIRKISMIIDTVDKQTKVEFDDAFEKWKEDWLSNPITVFSSDTHDAMNLPTYAVLKNMGAKILPLVVGKLTDETNFVALVLYDDLQKNPTLKISYDDPKQEGWLLEGEQSRSRRTVKLWLAAQDK